MTGAATKENILIVGSLAFDSVETPSGRADMAMGGSASFASIAASYFATPLVVGVVGDDFEDTHIRKFVDHGVDVRGIDRVSGKTFHWRGRYHDNFKERDTLETALNVFETFDPVIPEAYQSARFVFLANIDPSLQLKVLDQTRSAELVAMDTMNFWIDSAREPLQEVLRRVDIVFMNDEEALQLTGDWTILGAAQKILAMGPRYVVIKRGEYGALLFGPDLTLYVPAVLLPDVIDPTGAGDSFAGGFLGQLSLSGKFDRPSLGQALLTGTVMASFSVEAFSVDGICGLSDERIVSRRSSLEDMTRLR